MSYSRPKDIARRMAGQRATEARRAPDSYRRETFSLPREAAREKAREMFRRFPKAAYMTAIQSWRELPDADRVHHAAAAERGLAPGCRGPHQRGNDIDIAIADHGTAGQDESLRLMPAFTIWMF